MLSDCQTPVHGFTCTIQKWSLKKYLAYFVGSSYDLDLFDLSRMDQNFRNLLYLPNQSIIVTPNILYWVILLLKSLDTSCFTLPTNHVIVTELLDMYIRKYDPHIDTRKSIFAQ